MIKSAEQRNFTRCPVHARTEVRLDNGLLMEGESRNVSLNGMLITSERLLPVGNTCRVALMLHGNVDNFRIEMHGQVVRVDEAGIAIEFSQIDLESLEHLRKLVLYNADDADHVQDEIDQSTGLYPRR